MSARFTASVTLVHDLVVEAGLHGVGAAELLHVTGVPREALDDPDGRVDFAALMRGWSLLEARSGDPCFGLHVGERRARRLMNNLVGIAFYHCRTFGEAAQVLARYAHLVNSAMDLSVRRRQRLLEFRRSPRAGSAPATPAYAEYVSAFFVCTLRQWTGAELPVRAATFRHPAPRDRREHVRIFGPKLQFGAPYDTLSFDERHAELEFPAPSPAVVQHLEQRAERLLSSLPRRGGFEAEVRKQLVGRLPSSGARIDGVAKALGVSKRTLLRRLSDEETTFSQIVEEVRETCARRLLDERTLSVPEIAAAIGYRDVDSFRAAFRRWTGTTPRRYRVARRR